MTITNTTIQIKKSLVSGNTPSSLANGEIAINQADGKLFYSTPSGSVAHIKNQDTFATINVGSSLILATSPTDTLSIISGNNITISACTVTKSITINGSSIDDVYILANNATTIAQLAYDKANTALPNTGNIITVNSDSVLFVSNTTQSSSNTTGALVVAGGVGISGNTVISGQTDLGGNTGSQNFRVLNTTSSVNFWNVRGGDGSTTSPRFTTDGTGTNIAGQFATKGTGAIQFLPGNTEAFRITNTPSSVNYQNITGASTANTPIHSVAGSDTNIALALVSKGTGGIDLATGSAGINISNGGTITGITRTAAGSNYTSIPSVSITAPTTPSGTQAVLSLTMAAQSGTAVTPANGGTGYTLNDVLTVVGGTFTQAARFTVTGVSGGVVTQVTRSTTAFGVYTVLPTSPASTTGGTGTGCTLNMLWEVLPPTITNPGSGYLEQPTVSFSGGGGSGAAAYATVGSGTKVQSLGSTMSFYVPSGEGLRVRDNSTTAVNYATVKGSISGSTVDFGVDGTDAGITLALKSKGPGGIFMYTAGGNNTQFGIPHTASAVNYVQVTGAVTGGLPQIAAAGSDSSVSMSYWGKGASGYHYFYNTSGTLFGVTSSGTVANRLQVQGTATGIAPNLSAQGSDTNINLALTPKGTGTVQFGSQQANYLQAASAATTLTPIHSVAGSDTNIALAFQSKGTGGIDLAAGSSGINISNGGTVTAITRTAAGTGYTSPPTWSAIAPTTPGGTTASGTTTLQLSGSFSIVSGGAGYSVNDVLTVSGGTFTTAAQITVTSVSAGVITGVSGANNGNYSVIPSNPASFTGGTGTGASITLPWGVHSTFTITNPGSGYLEQPTVSFSGGGGSGAAAYATVGSGTKVQSLGSTMSFYTPEGETLRITDTGITNPAYLNLQPSAAFVYQFAQGAGTNVGIDTVSKGSGSIIFSTNGSPTNQQLQITHTASAVNYVQVTGGVTTARPAMSAQGSDTNIGLSFSAKGSGNILFFQSGSTTAGTNQTFQITNGGNANYLSVSPTNTGFGPTLSSLGSDTNIDLALTPKGTGSVTTSATLRAGLISGGTF